MTDPDFYAAIRKFNEIYALPGNDSPTSLGSERLRSFLDILREEVAEGDELLEKFADGKDAPSSLELLTELADWLGDLIVYCASEARRWGIPLASVLRVIMESNFSKLDANGEPIKDARGKVLKGPHYWRPEEKIKALLLDANNRSAP